MQRQFNLVDSLTAIAGAHQIKLGVDLRHLALRIDGDGYAQVMTFATEAEIVSGVGTAFITQNIPRTPVMRSYSAYAQDTWRLAPSLTLTYGVRWDANPAPFDRDGGRPFVLRGSEPSTTRVMPLPENEPLYATRWWNLAPRLGVSYRLAERRPGWDTVLRGGAGLFYDLGNSSPLWAFDANPPFAMSVTRPGVPYPLSAADAAPPLTGIPTTIVAVDPNLRLPYTWQWNAAVAQSLGQAQTLTVTYVGAAGRRLLQRRHFETLAVTPSPTGGSLITSDSTSAYRALQLQFQRRLSKGLQALASYSWAHAQDAQSDDLNVIDDQARWGNADFDVRHSVAAALSYDLPSGGGVAPRHALTSARPVGRRRDAACLVGVSVHAARPDDQVERRDVGVDAAGSGAGRADLDRRSRRRGRPSSQSGGVHAAGRGTTGQRRTESLARVPIFAGRSRDSPRVPAARSRCACPSAPKRSTCSTIRTS